MKNILFVAIAALVLASCSNEGATTNETTVDTTKVDTTGVGFGTPQDTAVIRDSAAVVK